MIQDCCDPSVMMLDYIGVCNVKSCYLNEDSSVSHKKVFVRFRCPN